MERALRFREDGSFKMMQWTDVHYTFDDADDARSLALLRDLLASERPDFVMVSGDLVFGEQAALLLPKALAPLCASGIPWSFVFGNHDAEYADNADELFEILRASAGFVGGDDPHAGKGKGNHFIPIYDRGGRTPWLIAGLDSGRDHPMKKIGGYDRVTRQQIDWYLDQVRAWETRQGDFSVFAFQHMPVPEIEDVWRFETTYGCKREGFGSPTVNSGETAALLEDGHTRALFFGHDHMNSFYGEYFGLTLGYGRASGYGGYGKPDFPRGCRMFVLHENPQTPFETYEVLDTGERMDDPWKHRPLERRDGG